MRYLAIEDGATVERDTEIEDSYLEGVKDEDSLTQSDAEDDADELLLRRLEKSLRRARRKLWMIAADDLLLKAGVTDNVAAWAGVAFEDGLTPAEFLLDFLGRAQ